MSQRPKRRSAKSGVNDDGNITTNSVASRTRSKASEPDTDYSSILKGKPRGRHAKKAKAPTLKLPEPTPIRADEETPREASPQSHSPRPSSSNTLTVFQDRPVEPHKTIYATFPYFPPHLRLSPPQPQHLFPQSERSPFLSYPKADAASPDPLDSDHSIPTSKRHPSRSPEGHRPSPKRYIQTDRESRERLDALTEQERIAATKLADLEAKLQQQVEKAGLTETEVHSQIETGVDKALSREDRRRREWETRAETRRAEFESKIIKSQNLLVDTQTSLRDVFESHHQQTALQVQKFNDSLARQTEVLSRLLPTVTTLASSLHATSDHLGKLDLNVADRFDTLGDEMAEQKGGLSKVTKKLKELETHRQKPHQVAPPPIPSTSSLNPKPSIYTEHLEQLDRQYRQDQESYRTEARKREEELDRLIQKPASPKLPPTSEDSTPDIVAPKIPLRKPNARNRPVTEEDYLAIMMSGPKDESEPIFDARKQTDDGTTATDVISEAGQSTPKVVAATPQHPSHPSGYAELEKALGKSRGERLQDAHLAEERADPNDRRAEDDEIDRRKIAMGFAKISMKADVKGAAIQGHPKTFTVYALPQRQRRRDSEASPAPRDLGFYMEGDKIYADIQPDNSPNALYTAERAPDVTPEGYARGRWEPERGSGIARWVNELGPLVVTNLLHLRKFLNVKRGITNETHRNSGDGERTRTYRISSAVPGNLTAGVITTSIAHPLEILPSWKEDHKRLGPNSFQSLIRIMDLRNTSAIRSTISEISMGRIRFSPGCLNV